VIVKPPDYVQSTYVIFGGEITTDFAAMVGMRSFYADRIVLESLPIYGRQRAFGVDVILPIRYYYAWGGLRGYYENASNSAQREVPQKVRSKHWGEIMLSGPTVRPKRFRSLVTCLDCAAMIG
jgi:hypothetical protein